MTSTVDGAASRPPDRRLTRRSVVRGLGLGGAALAVAGTGLLSYRAYDAGVVKTSIDEAVLAVALTALTDLKGLDGVAVHWIVEPGPRQTLGGLLVAAAEALIDDEQQSRDNFAWFRADRGDEERHRDGLVLDGQGLSPFELGIAKLLPPYTRAAGDQFWVDKTRDVHTATAAAYGVITTTAPHDRRIHLNAGRLLQRIHLGATVNGIALQHMNQITERIDREASTGSAATFAPRFAALLPAGARPLLTFRVGYPVRTGRPTPRRSAAMLLR